ncbi:16S rRNA m(2)G 1207 methyltransferase [Marinobacter segnicrescens]|uniref:Ribosomal RNA small subunit methyltransferase C n=1 Tax=Marinobacter segnicrescens TaxID=430453 RepID=A0A1H9Z0P7_9GAMM|nr:class I SAM-dependent methyltransferase [Marinobacter segnicrescens]SES75054.1 16S rRNA m(2)G 1207 methyltransferase [Marinobacter segnicrescens]
MTARKASNRDQTGGRNPLAALERNAELVTGRTGLLGLSLPELPDLPGAGQPLVITEHAGVAAALERRGDCRVQFGYELSETERGSLDTLVIFVPKARETLVMQLALARDLLSAQGRLVLVGEKREGIAGAARQLQAVAPEARKVDSARHCQVWTARLPAAETPFCAQQWVQWYDVDCAGARISVAGVPGIFSDGRLDEGTARLLETLADTPVRGPVLDFACGAGVIGAWLQVRYPELGPVDGVDVQAQAVFCARQTYERNGAKGDILASDGLPDQLGSYLTVITNPPFHTGVRIDTSMTESFLRQVGRHLAPGGELRLVANRFLPYQELIEAHIGPCRVLAEDKRFTVYQAVRQRPASGRGRR